jgi:hypothetical protein
VRVFILEEMKTKGLTFVTIMIMVALLGLILRLSIEQLIRWNIVQNEANAKDTLKLVSIAVENYAEDHLGTYPVNLTALCESEPPYIDKSYTQMGSAKGYAFECSVLDATGYSCSAVPLKCKVTGKTTYRVTTGGSMISESCSQKE